ncbi:MAG TPA: amino acid adenylation domain-containing protein, partial [Cytophagales bacterium]
DELVTALHLQRDRSRNVLFDVMVDLQEAGGSSPVTAQRLKDLTVRAYEGGSHSVSKFDLTFMFVESAEGLGLTLEYNSDLFAPETIVRMQSHFEGLLRAAVANPDLPVAQLDYLSEGEKRQLLEVFNDTAVAYPKDRTLVSLFEGQVEKTPDAVALVFQQEPFTFAQLNEKANQLAHYLIEHYQLQPDDRVGILLERSQWMVVALLGVLKAGAAYVPIDLAYPQQRIDYLLSDSGCKLLLDQTELDRFLTLEQQYSRHNPPLVNSPSDLAYVLYTSGSTGKPKGAMLEHHGVVNRIEWMWRQYGFSAHSVILQKTTFTFDVSVWELFLPLCWGARMVLATRSDMASPERLLALIEHHKVTCLHFVPSMLKAFIAQVFPLADLGLRLASLQGVITSGEALGLQTVKAWYGRLSVPVHNLYGPTEASIDVTAYSTRGQDSLVPIGRPIANTQIYILSQGQHLQPVGVAGEICIGGVGLARGYLNREQLTAERFVANPFVAGQQMYRTGDLGRWLEDGNIEYLGRIDEQVKVRGYRIELGEIEQALLVHEAIEQAVVVAKTTGTEKELVAYFTTAQAATEQAAADGQPITTAQLRAFLGQSLPEYMVPAHFVQLQALPLTPNGKVDRNALPDPATGAVASGTDYKAPGNETEEILVAIWEEVLGRTGIGVQDNFFTLGGHSLKATRLVSRIHKQFGVKVGIKDLLTHMTVESLSDIIRAEQWLDNKGSIRTETRNIIEI